MDFGLAGKVVFITGAGGGIGRAAAVAFAREGAQLGLIDRDRDRLVAAAEELRGPHSKVETAVGDLTAASQRRAAVGGLLDAFGAVDVLVNCAGVLQLQPFGELDDDGWVGMFRANFVSAAEVTKLVLPLLRRRPTSTPVSADTGSVLFVTSDLVAHPQGFAPAYEVAKAALAQLVGGLAALEGQWGVRVNAVAPGPTNTPMLDGVKQLAAEGTGLDPEEAMRQELEAGRGQVQGRLLEPGEIAECLVWLASPRAGCVTGQILGADGGTGLR